MSRVAIAGGGITGLTAAFRLRARGVDVDVFEAGPRAGGAIATTARDGFLAEHGPNSILETSPAVADLVEQLGLASQRQYPSPLASKRYVVRRHQTVAMPMSPPALVKTRLFSASAKLRVLREPFIPRAAPDAEETLAEFVRRRLGGEFLDYAINPFVAGVYAGDPERLAVRHAFPKLHALEQKYGSLIRGTILGARERKRRGEVSKAAARMFSFDGGLARLPDAIAGRLGSALHLGAAVTRVAQRPHGWQVETGAGAGDYDAVLLAASGPGTAAIAVETTDGWTPAPLTKLYHPPVTSMVLGFRRGDVAHPLDGFGVLVPAKERLSILGVLFSSSLFPNRAPEGHVTLTAFIGGARAPELAELGPAAVERLVRNDLEVLLGVHGEPVFRHPTTWPQAIPQYELGYGTLRAWMDEAEEKHPGLLLAGNFRDGISVADCIVSGGAVSERIATFLHAPAAAMARAH